MAFDEKLLAYCGIYCGQCSFKLAHDERDDKHVRAILNAQDWKVHETDKLEGCKGQCLCRGCHIQSCAAEKRLVSCADCETFPCSRIDGFQNDGISHHRLAVENLHSIRKNGIEAWFKAFEPTLSCVCGFKQSWYYTCPQHKSR